MPCMRLTTTNALPNRTMTTPFSQRLMEEEVRGVEEEEKEEEKTTKKKEAEAVGRY
jgi:hypothetical protein